MIEKTACEKLILRKEQSDDCFRWFLKCQSTDLKDISLAKYTI